MRLLSPPLLRQLQQANGECSLYPQGPRSGITHEYAMDAYMHATERIAGSPDHLFNLIADLLNDRYFSRMWTIQEVVLSNKCSDFLVKSDQFN
jgi:hypothetical protein